MITQQDSAAAISLASGAGEQVIVALQRAIIWDSNLNEDDIYVLHEGVVKLIADCDGCRTLELLYPGAFFGGLIFLNIPDIKFQAVAATEVKVRKIHRADIDKLLVSAPQLIQSYLRNMSAYITNLKRVGSEAANINLRGRLVRYLKKDLGLRPLNLGGQPAVSKILFHEEWALMLGARRESVSRIFSELEKEGCIKLTDKHIFFLKDDFA